MPEILITGVVVFIAAIAAGFIALRFFKPSDKSAADLETLRSENAKLQLDLAAAAADLRHAKSEVERMTEEARSQTQQIKAITEERDALDRRVVKDVAELEALEARLKDLRDAKDQMALEFKEVAGKLMQSQSETFKTQNHEQIGQLLSPLKTKIEEFEKGVVASHKESLTQHSALKEQIRLLSEQSAKMSKETENLTRALKGKVQMQGAWGEMILETILQRSGLREGEEYTSQESHTGEDGKRVRTDYIINLPNGERIIIDAKVSLQDFEGFVNAEEETERKARLTGHAASVKNHIKTLAGKEYHSRAGGKLDFVIMFVPIEAALGAALQHDGELGFFAADNKVAIATPTTLTIALKTVAAIWRVERQNQNAAEIASRAGKLYDKFVGFLGDMSEIGDRLRQAEAAYDGALKKLSTGRGNIVGQVEKLKSMGGEANKTIPQEYLDADETPFLSQETTATSDEEAVHTLKRTAAE
ncbi:DNA recombination protein RmuC [Hyphococcus flavus]|uniref:DNA recombination protein RmuC homolog n=1 Tax=Hyphococcus flavus TaxID=1866326 RepID=A0AAE9ZFQ3_9PROT|nr:DNA recombination protein RmuC [Hyphococcus flavus]WDI32073.1 DNA recombination protein RmuC [Hyphococcus flavus]